MATPTTDLNVIGDLVYQLIGNLLGASPTDLSMNKFGLTLNGTAPHGTNEMESITAALSRTPTSLAWTAPGVKSFTITANCAWKLTYSGSAVFSIQSAAGATTWSGGSPSGVFGGNGSANIYRNTNSSPGATGTVTITFSNGAGGSTTLTVTLSTTY
jgi:outer membrane biosynthesis protein TonB